MHGQCRPNLIGQDYDSADNIAPGIDPKILVVVPSLALMILLVTSAKQQAGERNDSLLTRRLEMAYFASLHMEFSHVVDS